jgi:hypothetical protein
MDIPARRPAAALVSLLLVGAAVLVAAASWLRWASVCPIGRDWGTAACQTRQDHRFDMLPVTPPWDADPTWSLLAGLGLVLLGMALLLLPRVLPARRWQRSALVVATIGLLVEGSAAALSGVLGRVVEVPVHALVVYLWVLALPVALLLMIPGPAVAGPRRGLVLAALVLATPLPQVLFVSRFLVPYTSYDTAPWSDATVVPCLLVAALAIRPWRSRSDFSNQQRAHSLSL